MNEETHFIIRILAPVHIGCDEVYEPTGFVLDETSCTLTAFHPVDFVRHLSKGDLDRLTSICRRGDLESILDLYKFMKGKSAPGHKVEACKGLIEHYQKTLSTEQEIEIGFSELNKFTISRTSFHPVTQQPYILGTAVGAWHRLPGRASAGNNFARIEARRGIDKLYYQSFTDGGSLKRSIPFLKVSDFQPVGPYRTRIVLPSMKEKALQICGPVLSDPGHRTRSGLFGNRPNPPAKPTKYPGRRSPRRRFSIVYGLFMPGKNIERIRSLPIYPFPGRPLVTIKVC